MLLPNYVDLYEVVVKLQDASTRFLMVIENKSSITPSDHSPDHTVGKNKFKQDSCSMCISFLGFLLSIYH